MSEPSAPSTSDGRRRPWVAFLLALVAPGLGHLYAGRLRQTAIVVLAWLLLAAAIVWLLTQPFGTPFAIYAVALFLLINNLVFPIHAASVARSGRPLRVKRWLRISIYLIYIVAFYLIGSNAAAWVRSDLAEPFSTPSASMFPTLHVGDHFFTDKRAYLEHAPARGDVVVYSIIDSQGSRQEFVARVLGVPGDRIRVEREAIYLNESGLSLAPASSTNDTGYRLDLYDESIGNRSYRIARSPNAPLSRSLYTELLVDQYFLLKDNRDRARDSRFHGPVHRSDIIGRVTHVFFSRDPATGSINWTRTGLRIE